MLQAPHADSSSFVLRIIGPAAAMIPGLLVGRWAERLQGRPMCPRPRIRRPSPIDQFGWDGSFLAFAVVEPAVLFGGPRAGSRMIPSRHYR